MKKNLELVLQYRHFNCNAWQCLKQNHKHYEEKYSTPFHKVFNILKKTTEQLFE